MNIARLRVIAGACGYLILAFSASVNAREIEPVDSRIFIESWLSENGQEVPVLSFDGSFDEGALSEDIRAENITRDNDGSVRFQLSHTGPFSRQVFANVHSKAQEGDFTRNVITNIADGDQTEYLTRTVNSSALTLQERLSESSLLTTSAKTGGQEIECFSCVVIIAVRIACAEVERRAFQQCHQMCQNLGGIRRFSGGSCGAPMTECMCWMRPRENEIAF